MEIWGAEVSGNHNDLGNMAPLTLPMQCSPCGLQQCQTQRPLVWHWRATASRGHANSSNLKAAAPSKTERRAEKLLKRKLAKKARLRYAVACIRVSNLQASAVRMPIERHTVSYTVCAFAACGCPHQMLKPSLERRRAIQQ